MQRAASELLDSLSKHPRVTVRAHLLRSSARWTSLRTVIFLAGLIWRLPQIVKKNEIDVILFSSVTTAVPNILLRTWLRARCVRSTAVAHGLDVVSRSWVFPGVVRSILKSLDAVFPVSRATAQECIDRGMPPSRTHVVPNGIDVSRFNQPALKSFEAANPLSVQMGRVPQGSFLLISVARQIKRKGLAWFIDSVMPHLPDTVHHFLAGAGPEHKKILAAIQRHGLSDRVHLLGIVSEESLALLYGQGDLFVMPNIPIPGDMEGFGLAMLEAGAFGLPTIAADLEGIRDVIVDGKNGYRLPSRDAQAYVDKIAELQASPDILARLRRTTYETVNTFQWSASVQKYVDTFSRLINAPRIE